MRARRNTQTKNEFLSFKGRRLFTGIKCFHAIRCNFINKIKSPIGSILFKEIDTFFILPVN